MAETPTFNDLFEAARSEALLLPTKFSPEIIDTPGSDVNVVFAAAAGIGEEIARFAQASWAEAHLATAEGDALDRWVYDRYRLVRFEARSSTVTLRLERSNNSPGITIPADSGFSTEDGVTFLTLNDAVFPNGSVGPIRVDAVASDTGEGGNVPIGTINTVASFLEDDTVTVTNEEPSAGGSDQETDVELRARAQDFFLTARRGTRFAIEFGATQTPGVEQATAEEILDGASGFAAGRVILTISDSEGQSNLALATRVASNLDEYRALGVPVVVSPGVQQLVEIEAVGLLFQAGFNTTNVLGQARNVILATVNGLAPGVTLRRASILAAMDRVDGLIVPDSALVEPAGDVVPNNNSVIRTTTDRILLNA